MGGPCTFGTRAPVDINHLNEIIHRENKFFRNYNTYTPKFSAVPVTSKFYAKHDLLVPSSEEEQKKLDGFYRSVRQVRAQGPHSKFPEPVTGNMEYGWNKKPLVPLKRNDERFYHPKKESEHTKIEVIIRMANPQKHSAS